VIRRLFLTLAALSLAASPIVAQQKPLVTMGGQTRQLPSGTTLGTQPSTSAAASINIPVGVEPAAPANGDIWVTNSGLRTRIGNVTQGIATLGAGNTWQGTGLFFSQNNSRIQRMGDRLFIADAVANDGAFPNVSKDWLSTLQTQWGQTIGYTVGGTLNVLNTGVDGSAYAIVGGAQSKNFTAHSAAIGTQGFGIANNANGSDAWGLYAEGHRVLAGAGSAYAMELDAVAHVPSQAATPNQQGNVIGAQIACGGDYQAITQNACSTAIQVAQNGSTFGSALNVLRGSITGTNPAIQLPTGNGISFADAAGHQSGNITADFTTSSSQINFTDIGLQIAGSDASPTAYFSKTPGSTNWLTFTGTSTGSANIAADGAGSNTSLQLSAKGSGTINGLNGVALFTPPSVDLTYGATSPGDTIRLGTGNKVSYCPELSCVPMTTGNVVHHVTSGLLSAVTAFDGQAQEDTLAVHTKIDKGYNRPLARSTAYTAGENARIGNAVYRATTSGTTASGSPPPSTRPVSFPYSYVDGGVTWLWINDFFATAKVGIYNEAVVSPGAGASWAQANNYQMMAGVTPTDHINTELDFTNNSGTDCAVGTTNCNGLLIVMGGTNSSTSAINVNGGNGVLPGSGTANWGLRLNGTWLQDSLAIDSSAQRGIVFGGLLAANFSVATIDDHATAPASYIAGGANSVAAMLLNGTGPAAISMSGSYTDQIVGNGFSVSGNGNTVVNSLSVNGNLIVPNPIVPASSSSACAKGQISYDTNYFYVCVATNSWKRTALSSW
jgi:hypothetical protein